MNNDIDGNTRSLADRIRENGHLPRTISIADLGNLNEELAFLFNGLRIAHHLKTEGHGRLAAIVALRAVSECICRFESVVQAGLNLPLFEVVDALGALDLNRVMPILKPNARAGRSQETAAERLIVGASVGAISQLRYIGLGDKVALQAVAGVLASQGVTRSRGTGGVTARTLRGWREKVAADVNRSTVSAMEADKLISENWKRRLTSVPVELARRRVLDRLADSVRRHRFNPGQSAPPKAI